MSSFAINVLTTKANANATKAKDIYRELRRKMITDKKFACLESDILRRYDKATSAALKECMAGIAALKNALEYDAFQAELMAISKGKVVEHPPTPSLNVLQRQTFCARIERATREEQARRYSAAWANLPVPENRVTRVRFDDSRVEIRSF